MSTTDCRTSPTIRALAAYASDGGRFCEVPPGTTRSGIDIGLAVRAYQWARRRDKLGPRTVNKLEALPGWTWERPRDFRWKGAAALTIRALQAYAATGAPCAGFARDLVVEGVHLARAASDLRSRFHRGELTPDAVSALAALPGWTWGGRVRDTSASPEYGRSAGRRPHAEVFLLLERFAERHGHAWVPRYHVEDGFRLGAWVFLQRRLYRRGQVPAGRVRRLEILPGWSWDPTADRATAKRLLATPAGTLLALRAHVAEAGKAAAIVETTQWMGLPLRPALEEVRRLHALRQLPPRLVRGFEAVQDWDWTPTDRIGIWLTALRTFVAREGHAGVPSRHREGDVALGRWLVKARVRYHAGVMPAAEAAVLESMPGWAWRPRLAWAAPQSSVQSERAA